MHAVDGGAHDGAGEDDGGDDYMLRLAAPFVLHLQTGQFADLGMLRLVTLHARGGAGAESSEAHVCQRIAAHLVVSRGEVNSIANKQQLVPLELLAGAAPSPAESGTMDMDGAAAPSPAPRPASAVGEQMDADGAAAPSPEESMFRAVTNKERERRERVLSQVPVHVPKPSAAPGTGSKAMAAAQRRAGLMQLTLHVLPRPGSGATPSASDERILRHFPGPQGTRERPPAGRLAPWRSAVNMLVDTLHRRHAGAPGAKVVARAWTRLQDQVAHGLPGES